MGPVWEPRAPEIQRMLDEGWSIGAIAKHYGAKRHVMRSKMSQLRKKGLLQYEDRATHHDDYKAKEVDKDIQSEIDKFGVQREIDGKTLTHKSTRLLEMSEAEDKDPNFLMSNHGYDPNEWDLVNSRSKMWHAYSKVDYVVTLYSSSITVKPKERTYSDHDMMAFFERLARDYQSPVHTPTRYTTSGKLLELNIADLHLGKLAWAGDSGDTYNHEIARERFFYIINDVITRTKEYKFERILFVWCNDFYHFDGPSKTTTNGTPQDASLQYEQMFELGCEMLVQAIEMLSQIAPVTTMYVASNHDRHVSYFATKYLSAWYRNNPHIRIDSRALSRKAVRFGKCLIGFTHGDKEKKRIKEWMQVEYAPDWGETIFREVHAAHIHSERSIEEDGGQIIRYVSSPTGTDKWHNNSAWIGAIQKGQTFIWDRENGLEDTKNTVVRVGGSTLEAIVV